MTLALAIHEKLSTRHVRMDDLAAVVDLINLVKRHETGEPAMTLTRLRTEWTDEHFNPTTDAWVVARPDGELIAYAECWAGPPYVHLHLWGVVHPDWQRQGIGTHLMELAEARAQEAVPLAPDGARVTLRVGTDSENAAGHALHASRGYTVVRHFQRMIIELDPDAPPEEPVWPEGLRLRGFDPEADARAVYRAMDEGFRDHWGHISQPEEEGFRDWWHHMTGGDQYDPALWFLAVDESSGQEEIAAICLCRPFTTQDPDCGWVSQLAVRKPWRRRGLALALLNHAFNVFYAQGKPRVGLGVDSQNTTGANRLYERAGMHVARQWDSYEREIRPGEELAKTGP